MALAVSTAERSVKLWDLCRGRCFLLADIPRGVAPFFWLMVRHGLSTMGILWHTQLQPIAAAFPYFFTLGIGWPTQIPIFGVSYPHTHLISTPCLGSTLFIGSLAVKRFPGLQTLDLGKTAAIEVDWQKHRLLTAGEELSVVLIRDH